VWDLYEDFRKELQLGLPYNPSALLAEARAKNQAPPIHARAVMDNVPWKDWTREQSMALMPKIVALAKALASGEAQQDGGSAWHSCMCCVKPQMFGYELHEHPHKPTCIHNANTAFKDALGHTKRSLSKAGKVALPLLGQFLVRDCKSKVEFEVGVGFKIRQRRKMWKELQANPLAYNGRIMKYKHFPHGAKNKPRHAIFLGWRSKLDIDTPSPIGRLNVPGPAIQNIPVPVERVYTLENLAHAFGRPKRKVTFTTRRKPVS
jgi:hypothetical protein